MIATVVLFTEERVFKGVLMSDVGAAAMCERAQQILVQTGAGLEDVELVSGEQGRS